MDGSVTVTDPKGPTTNLSVELYSPPASAPNAPQWYALSNSTGGDLTAIAAATNSLGTAVTVNNSPSALAISPNAQFAYITTSGNSGLTVIALSSMTVQASVTVGSTPKAVAVSPSGAMVYTANYNGASVSVYSVAAVAVVATISLPSGAYPTSIAVSPQGTFIYVVDFYGHVYVIDAATNAVTATISTGALQTYAGAFSPDGSFFYVSGFISGYNTIFVINTTTNAVVTTITTTFSSGGEVGIGSSVAVTSAGDFVYVGIMFSGAIVAVETATWTIAATILLPTSNSAEPQSLAMSPSGNYMYVGTHSTNYAGYVISTATNKIVDTVVPASDLAQSLSYVAAVPAAANGGAGSQISLVGPQVSGGTLAGVIAGLVALGLFTS